MTERITFNGGDGRLDEVVLHGTSVHLERLDDTVFMLILDRPGFVGHGWQRQQVHLHLTLTDVTVFEYLINDHLVPDGTEWTP